MNRILIVEDERRIASFVEKGLRSNGFTPTVASDGITGLDYAQTGDFDLVVLDIGLPGLDGFTLLRRLRQAQQTIPVIVLTARDSGHRHRRRARGRRRRPAMAKPFRFDEAAGPHPASPSDRASGRRR